ncbi:2-oxo acid dehydrogenase subunit E2 [Streptomyces sp. TRM72054]|uniref:dihydrolipoamide acetyltransferase family protein n=1 Tax=Streptomyces sp. TRM72054 TaxID=2870562 RepID=UPI001C8B48D1|nr:dihydrolipoamide acetyltransferase family protein [Streptomyces sp. TRM72054]MBX9397140.1 2-oxo acid dehydrogenase subunit E2 [Streptomyces sp. TRM72054]
MTDTAERYREFRLPDVGEGLQDAEIIRWLVAPGDTVTDGQPVCEVETAKAAVELPVPFAGRVQELLFPEGATVDVGAAIIRVDTGEERAASAAAGGRTPVLVGYGAAPAPAGRRSRRRPTAPPRPTAPAAKPPVRKLAKDLGVDLTAIVPTGPRGDVTREDVHAAARTDEPVPAPEPQTPPSPDETRIPVTGVRKATARAMVASAFTAPHVTEFVTVDVTRTMKLIRRLKEHPDMTGVRVGPLLLAARAFLLAVRRNPEINASWDEERQEIVRKHRVNLGIAAATPRGLLVPTIADADRRTLPELAAALDDLVATAKEGRTPPAALRGGTVTLTNIGVFGVDTGTPILNPGESAILALGTIAPRPWVHRGKVVPRQVTTLALSFDHRLVDGELGSRVLADTAAVLHDPDLLFTRA